jgi:hypothetical protein
MADSALQIIKVGGWSWQVNDKAQGLCFLGPQDGFALAVDALNDLSQRHMNDLAVLVDYVENLSDHATAAFPETTASARN